MLGSRVEVVNPLPGACLTQPRTEVSGPGAAHATADRGSALLTPSSPGSNVRVGGGPLRADAHCGLSRGSRQPLPSSEAPEIAVRPPRPEAALLFSFLLLSGCGPAGNGVSVDVRNGRVVAPEGVPEASFYAEIRNRGDTPDTLTGLSVAGSHWAMLHGSHGTEDGGGHGHMEGVGHIVLPPGRRLAMASGGFHGMIGWAVPPALGETVSVTLHFARSGDITLQLPLQAPGEAR